FSRDGQSFATSGVDNCVRLWSMDRLRNYAVFDFGRLDPSGLAFSPSGKILAIVTNDPGFVWFVDTGTGKTVASVKSSGETIPQIAFAPDGEYFAAVSTPRSPKKGAPKGPSKGYPVAVWKVSAILK